MIIVKYRHILYGITAVVIALSIGAVAVFGLNLGVDFTGGSLIEARYVGERPDSGVLADALENTSITGFSLRPADDPEVGPGYILRAGTLSEEQREALPQVLSLNGEFEVQIERFTEVGPTIGAELRSKALIAIGLVIVAIILYVAFVFRHVSKPVSSWTYGLLAIIALLHDVIVPTGLFAIFGYIFGAQVDSLFVMALLAILGYSVNDTIVVFDRVRENLKHNIERGRHEDFELTVGKSLNQTFVRSVNTSATTLFVLLALFFLGPESTQYFALTLITGIIAGTYSSIALATPLLVTVERWRKRKK
jgi:preprotein translocase subunit SecF